MAQLSNEDFYAKWVPLLANNEFQNIDGPRFDLLLQDMRDSFANQAGQAAQPVPPAVNFDPATRQLTAQHPLGTGELEYAHNNGGFSAYAPIQVDDLGHTQGEWRFRVKGATGRNPSQLTDSPAIEVKLTVGSAGPFSILASQISDSSAVGRNLLRAGTYARQLELIDQLGLADYPQFARAYTEDGAIKYLLDAVAELQAAASPAPPAAPTAGQVDDTADTFSFLPNPLYPAFSQYKVSGLPGVTGAVVVDGTNSYVQGSRVYIKVVGAVAKGGLAVYVAGSGNRPDGQVLTNADVFTGTTVVTPPTPTTLTVGLAIAVASIMAGKPLTYTVTAAGGTGGYTYAVVATNTVTGASISLGSASTGSWSPTTAGDYELTATVTDSAGTSKISPVRALHVSYPPVANAGSDTVLTQPQSSVQLRGSGYEQSYSGQLQFSWSQAPGDPVNVTFNSKTIAQPTVSGLTAVGVYHFQLIVTDEQGNPSLADEVVVTVQAASSQPTVFTPQSSEFRYSQRNDTGSAGSGYVRRDAMAAWPLTTDATSLLVRGKTNFPSGGSLTVYVDGGWFQQLLFTQTGTEQEFNVTGLPSGSKLVDIYESGQERPNESGNVRVSNLTGVTVPVGFSGTVASPAKKRECVIILSNSRSAGGVVADGPRSAYPRVLGRNRNADVFVIGYASLQMGLHIVSQAAQQQVLAEIQARAAGYSTVRVLLGDSENDWGYGTFTPGQLLAAYQQLLPAIHAALPTAKLYVIGTVPDQNNADQQVNGYYQADFRAMELGLAGTQSYIFAISPAGANLVSGDFADAHHLKESGQAKYAQLVSDTFDASDSLPSLTKRQYMTLDGSGGATTLLDFTTNISDPEYSFNNLAFQDSNSFDVFTIPPGSYPVTVRSKSDHSKARTGNILVAETIDANDARHTYSPNWLTAADAQLRRSPFRPKYAGATDAAHYVQFDYNGAFELWSRGQPNVNNIGLQKIGSGQARYGWGLPGGPADYGANITLNYSHPAEGADRMQVDGANSNEFMWAYRLQYPPS